MSIALGFNFDLGARKTNARVGKHVEKKRGAGNEHAGSKGILGREKIKMADASANAMRFFSVLRFEIWLLMTNFG